MDVDAMIKILSAFKKRSVAEKAPETAATAVTTPQAESTLADKDWTRLRSPQFGHEGALSGWTRNWLETLPDASRPVALSGQYAQVANRLALAWRDPLLTDDLLKELLVGRRKGRKGFPPEIVAELQCLRDFHERGRPLNTPRAGSDTSPLEISDL
jgi:hypothetical protein